jgi:glycerate 2-kinase
VGILAHLPGVGVRPFRNHEALTGHGRTGLREDALAIAAAGLEAVDPVDALERLVTLDSGILRVGADAYRLDGRDVFLIGAGKATIGMAAVLDRLIGDRLRDAAVAVKHGQGIALDHIEVIESAHPVPDDHSLRAGLRLLGIADRAQPGDLVLAIVTGGSSSLAVAPAEGISLDDKVATNRLLLASGADIVCINNVRKHISRIKGGLLGKACDCTVVNLSVSDVVGDPPDYFSDLTVPDTSTFRMAQQVCERWDLWPRLPAPVVERLRRADPAAETPRTLDDVHTYVVANADMMCRAAAGEARRRGYDARVLTLELEGEAAEAGRWLAERLRGAAAGTALIAGGENTVTLPSGCGSPDHGLGGPSQEAALSAAIALRSMGPACVLCLDSDGTDGPTDACGGLVDDLSAADATAEALDAVKALEAHDCYDTLAAAGDLMFSGSTGTNVNDLKIALRSRD